jgi:hypothetical protein
VITFLPSLSGRLSVDHYPNFPCLPVFPTSYQVINTFASISFRATLSDGYQTGPADFGYLSGICFVHVIADVFIASSCPINRTGKQPTSCGIPFISILANRISVHAFPV